MGSLTILKMHTGAIGAWPLWKNNHDIATSKVSMGESYRRCVCESNADAGSASCPYPVRACRNKNCDCSNLWIHFLNETVCEYSESRLLIWKGFDLIYSELLTGTWRGCGAVVLYYEKMTSLGFWDMYLLFSTSLVNICHPAVDSGHPN